MVKESASAVGPDADVVAILRSIPVSDAAELYRAGLLALKAGQESAALPILTAAAARYEADPKLAQVVGLLARAQGDLQTAVTAFTRAHSLAPADILISHSLARSRLEAGMPAITEFSLATRLAPNDGTIIQGLAAAYFATGDHAGAITVLADTMKRNPVWLDGHATLARLRSLAGDDDPMRSYREALTLQPGNEGLWLAYLATMTLAERYHALPAITAAARKATGSTLPFDLYDAIAADETGAVELASTLFARLPAPAEPGAAIWNIRHRLRVGDFVEAAGLAERALKLSGARELWPYLALAWRLLGDARSEWLEGQAGLVRTFDLDTGSLDLTALAEHLRQLHLAKAQPLDQSVRGGTQTDGPLFSRVDPALAQVRAVITSAVERYVAELPAMDAAHPVLAARRDRVRFAGSWSVRLTGGGYHADHVHPQGWISSAFYVALPNVTDRASKAGWLTMGTCRALVPDLPPTHQIEPMPGRLVLFPSTMWHGTNPFAAGERLSIAFDVGLPTP